MVIVDLLPRGVALSSETLHAAESLPGFRFSPMAARHPQSEAELRIPLPWSHLPTPGAMGWVQSIRTPAPTRGVAQFGPLWGASGRAKNEPQSLPHPGGVAVAPPQPPEHCN